MSSTQDEATPARKPPKLLPFALLAFGTTAVVVPFILLRRARARAALNEFAHAPPRRAGQSTILPRSEENHSRAPSREQSPDPGALDPLYALKAFSIATCVVGASALAGVGAVRWSLGVQNTEEFGRRMRAEVQSFAPVLSSRIFRPVTAADTPPSGDATISSPDAHLEGGEGEWTWADAVLRLSRAYEEGGLSSWLEAAGRELEREAHVERRRRGHNEHDQQNAKSQNV